MGMDMGDLMNEARAVLAAPTQAESWERWDILVAGWGESAAWEAYRHAIKEADRREALALAMAAFNLVDLMASGVR